jgi:hypothetical protein
VEVATYIIGACLATYRPFFADLNKKLTARIKTSGDSPKTSRHEESANQSTLASQKMQSEGDKSSMGEDTIELNGLSNLERPYTRRGQREVQETDMTKIL